MRPSIHLAKRTSKGAGGREWSGGGGGGGGGGRRRHRPGRARAACSEKRGKEEKSKERDESAEEQGEWATGGDGDGDGDGDEEEERIKVVTPGGVQRGRAAPHCNSVSLRGPNQRPGGFSGRFAGLASGMKVVPL